MLATIGFIPTKIKSSSNKVKKEKELIVPKLYTHSCAVGQTGCKNNKLYIPKLVPALLQ